MFSARLRTDTDVDPEKEYNPHGNDYIIGDYGYGKDYVKIMHVVREGPIHSIKEFEVSTHLKLYSKKDYLRGDNSDIIATDSQKNTVYLLAKKHGIKTPEEFALLLTSHFLNKYHHVREVHIHIEQYPWERISQEPDSNGYNKQKHNHAFVFTPVALRFCDVTQKRDEKPIVVSGLKNLRVLKTTQSSFVNFVSDEFRSLPDMTDRIFSTIVESKWEYSTIDHVKFCDVWNLVKSTILKCFAGDPSLGIPSPSVQNTLYISEREVLDKVPEITSISMQMPNKHYFTFDTSQFQTVTPGDNKEVYIPVDKPSGIIYARLDRNDIIKSKL